MNRNAWILFPDNIVFTAGILLRSLRKMLESLYSRKEAHAVAVIYLAGVLKITRTELLVRPEQKVPEILLKRIRKDISHLAGGMPVQYVLGETEFCGLGLNVSRNVLIPRQETEELVRHVIRDNSIRNPVILDVGTGSGCIAVSLKKNIPGANVYGFDNKPGILRIASRNARINCVRIAFRIVDIFNRKWPFPGKYFDVLVSNPPYISKGEEKKSPKNVIDFEPHNALFAPSDDPLAYYKEIVRHSRVHLKKGGKIYFEVHEKRGRKVLKILKKAGFTGVVLIKDLNGKDRFSTGTYAG